MKTNDTVDAPAFTIREQGAPEKYCKEFSIKHSGNNQSNRIDDCTNRKYANVTIK